jgi:hypothetical protein
MGAAVAGTNSEGAESRPPKPSVAPAETLTTAYTASSRSGPRRFRPTASHTTLRDATSPYETAEKVLCTAESETAEPL